MSWKSVLVACVTVLGFTRAQAQEPLVALTGARRATFRDATGSAADLASLVFAADPGLLTVQSPMCPNFSSLRFSSSRQVNAEVILPCANWSLSGGGFRYRDPSGAAGGVQKIIYRVGKLVIRVKGAGYAPPIDGPITWAEVRFRVGASQAAATTYCGRLDTFPHDDATLVRASGPSVACNVVCGDGIAEGGEACDDGNAVDGDGCDHNCTPTGCGNGIRTAGEQCDDGNTAPGDGCRADCTVERCGDSIVDPGEQCDDGNTVGGDCCSATCQFENGMPCTDHDDCTSNDVCVNGACLGSPIAPWVNEFDYDDFRRGGVTDSDEFVEIAGPAGTDLGGYQVMGIAGNPSCPLNAFTGVTAGNANFTVVIPPGTVLANDTGTGIGFLVVCFTGSSYTHILAGDCDVVLPAPSPDSNLQNGDLLNQSLTNCPNGILVLDPASQLIDAISYEGIVPNVGNFGHFFQTPAYSAGQDQGWKNRVSMEKQTSTLGRALSAAEWHLTGGCTTASPTDSPCAENSDSPGRSNAGQTFQCMEPFCGDGHLDPGEECDLGAANSNLPNAACRPDCTLRRCGDGVVDPTAAPGFPEECEQDSDCLPGETCFACQCETGTPLGPLPFSVVPGPSALNPPDDGQSTLLRVTPQFGITNGTQGDFDPGPLMLAAGVPDANGRAPLVLAEPVVLGADLPNLAGAGKVCVRLRQDPDFLGWVDCDGGSNADVTLTIDSNGAGANGSPVVTVPAGAGDSGPGAAVIRVLAEAAITADSVTPCASATFAAPLETALTTATATSTITDALQGGSTTVVLAGQPFTCGHWVEDAGASIAGPNVNMDVALPLGLGTVDIAQVLRLNDD